MTESRPILVTGAHRTGTTWVGKMLSAHPQLAYISEPFNVWHRPGVMSAPVSKWYTYIHEGNEGEYLPALHAMLAFRYHLGKEVLALRSFKDVLRMGRDLWGFQVARARRQRPLIKDPFAVFSVAWFARRLDCRIVITVRHPAAFASSLKRLDWKFDFRDLLDQSRLMQDWLEEDRAEMEAVPEGDVIGQAALLWRVIYRMVHNLQGSQPGFIILRHEDLSRGPLSGFQKLYEQLGLEYSAQVAQAVSNSSSGDNPIELSRKKVHSVRLDSRSSLKNWKKRLSGDEVSRIRHSTEAIAHLYYPDSEWA